MIKALKILKRKMKISNHNGVVVNTIIKLIKQVTAIEIIIKIDIMMEPYPNIKKKAVSYLIRTSLIE